MIGNPKLQLLNYQGSQLEVLFLGNYNFNYIRIISALFLIVEC